MSDLPAAIDAALDAKVSPFYLLGVMQEALEHSTGPASAARTIRAYTAGELDQP